MTVTLLLAAEIADPYASMLINTPGGTPATAVIFAAAVFTPWGSSSVGSLYGQYQAAPLSGGAAAFEMDIARAKTPGSNSPYIELREYGDFFGTRISNLDVSVADLFFAEWTRVGLSAPVIAFSNAVEPFAVAAPLPAPALLLCGALGALLLRRRVGGAAQPAAERSR